MVISMAIKRTKHPDRSGHHEDTSPLLHFVSQAVELAADVTRYPRDGDHHHHRTLVVVQVPDFTNRKTTTRADTVSDMRNRSAPIFERPRRRNLED